STARRRRGDLRRALQTRRSRDRAGRRDLARGGPALAFGSPGVSSLIVVGAGVVGSALALAAADRGHDVLLLERDQQPRRASIRNVGLIWICGRAAGRELELALDGRRRWESLDRRARSIGFRETGSLLVVRDPAELALLEAACARPDAAERGFALLSPDEARRHNPDLGGALLGALHCPLDAIVEPARARTALRTLAR